MGCWGYGIKESDDALDAELHLQDMAGTRHTQATRGKLEVRLTDMLSGIELFGTTPGKPSAPSYDNAVHFQVLAAMLMEHGCVFHEDDRSRMAHGIANCDEYIRAKTFAAGTNTTECNLGQLERMGGRVKAIDQLLVQLAVYDIAGGKPSRVESRGLMETLSARIIDGEANVASQRLNCAAFPP